MTNDNMQSPEDEWVLIPDNSELRIQVDWEAKVFKGAEYKGIYHKIDTFTDEIKMEIEKFVKTMPLPFKHFNIPWQNKEE